MKINNLKLIGLWRYNSDGIDVLNSQDVAITYCFIRSFDDSIVIKGVKGYDQQPVRNVTAKGCVIGNDWNKAIEGSTVEQHLRRPFPFTSYAGTPLISRARVIGILSIYWVNEIRDFGDADMGYPHLRLSIPDAQHTLWFE